jgi:hypothetical protein
MTKKSLADVSLANVSAGLVFATLLIGMGFMPKCSDLQLREEAQREHAHFEQRLTKQEDKLQAVHENVIKIGERLRLQMRRAPK